MTARLYKAWNGPSPTTAVQVAVTTGTAIKTLLQLATPSTLDITIKAWGISFDGAAAAAGVQCELVETGSVGATVTAHVAAGLVKQNVPAGLASQLTLGTSATGYTASAEGAITTTRMFDSITIQPTGAYVFQWPLGDEPVVEASKILRVRVDAVAAVNALCWIMWAE
jgi:hypothetical protein